MAWYSSSLAFAVRPEDAVRVADAVALQNAWTKDTPFIHAMSRNGVLLATVNAVNMQCAPGRDIYLNQQFARLQDADLAKAHEQIGALIDCIDKNPGEVLEATKLPYTPHFLKSKRGRGRFFCTSRSNFFSLSSRLSILRATMLIEACQ